MTTPTDPIAITLPMTSVEKLHWFDQNERYPNFVFARLRFATALDPGLAGEALMIALARQPLAFMQPAKFGNRWCWTTDRGAGQLGRYFRFQQLPSAPDDWDLTNDLDQFTAYHLTLFEFVDGEDGLVSEARFRSHHAASDGVASIGMINDWICIYNNLATKQTPVAGLTLVDQGQFQRRGKLGLMQWNYLKRLPMQAIALFGAAKFIFRKTETLDLPALKATHGRARMPSDDYPCFLNRWLDAVTRTLIQRRAGTWNVSVTALSLAVYFQAIVIWQQELSDQPARDDQPDSIYRILLPISVRGRHAKRLPAANRTAIVQIDRQPAASFKLSAECCRSIDREINIIKQNQLEKMFLIAIRLTSISNGWLDRVANQPASRGVGVFTHLGQPFKAARIHADRLPRKLADARLARVVDFGLVGPIRSGTPINLSVARHDDRLNLSLHYDGEYISPTAAQRLLEIMQRIFAQL